MESTNDIRFEGTDQYYLDPELRAIVNIALAMEKPLLLTGEAGTGKTQLAFEVSREGAQDRCGGVTDRRVDPTRGVLVADSRPIQDDRDGAGRGAIAGSS